jgi:hypothetical protein
MSNRIFFVFLLLTLIACEQSPKRLPTSKLPPKRLELIDGLSFVAPPKPFPADPMLPIQNVGAGWIAVIPYAFTKTGTPQVRYNALGGQWWGECHEGCRTTIKIAKAAGLKIMFKPQVFVPGSWTGDLDFSDPADWKKWEAGYEAYIMPLVEMAAQEGVELFCIGTEFKTSVAKRPQFWNHLIDTISTKYKGKLTYAANWNDYDAVPFWNRLDYIGINAYFPLSATKTPDKKELIKAWQPMVSAIGKLADQHKKPVLFTEFGYLSVDGCADKTWEIEKRIKSTSVNQYAQAIALDALFETFWIQPYWQGGFLWKWFPNMQGHEGYPEKDYTPQGKLGEQVLKKWYNNTP